MQRSLYSVEHSHEYVDNPPVGLFGLLQQLLTTAATTALRTLIDQAVAEAARLETTAPLEPQDGPEAKRGRGWLRRRP
ncbi:hypothetical protein ACWEPA_33300 [Streptomyces filamentosus]